MQWREKNRQNKIPGQQKLHLRKISHRQRHFISCCLAEYASSGKARPMVDANCYKKYALKILEVKLYIVGKISKFFKKFDLSLGEDDRVACYFAGLKIEFFHVYSRNNHHSSAGRYENNQRNSLWKLNSKPYDVLNFLKYNICLFFLIKTALFTLCRN